MSISLSRVQAFRRFTVAFLCISSLMSAHAAFHLWSIQEIYTDSSGKLQFIELATTEGGQNYVNGLSVTAAPGNRLTGHTITVPGNELPGDTTGHSLLFGTAGLQAAGGPAPDYIVPDSFLYQGAGNLNFFDAVFAAYSSLPLDGVHSWIAGGGTAVNSPRNYSGQTGFVIAPAPEPAASVLLGLGLVGMRIFSRKRVPALT